MITPLKNTIQQYAWGSLTEIPQLLGIPSTDKPQAELWMGAHPKSSSEVKINNQWVPLIDVITNNPENLLGQESVEKHGHTLPFLFKVLAADKPLSIQAHPNKIQAKQGFEKENELKIPVHDAKRNYKDSNHKPEIICALTDFAALVGFRPISEILNNIHPILEPETMPLWTALHQKQNHDGLQHFFYQLMTLTGPKKNSLIQKTVEYGKNNHRHDLWHWVSYISDFFPNDIGLLSPLFLNVFVLKPGESLYLPAGNLHAYLKGMCIELMANSDNVLRGGLTPKHIDVPELLSILTFESGRSNCIAPKYLDSHEIYYPTDNNEFQLSVIQLNRPEDKYHRYTKNAEILFCARGNGVITEANQKIHCKQGDSLLVYSCTHSYTITGNTTIYKATIP